MKVGPPIRTEKDRIALIEAVKDGVIDCIATDHAPHTLAEKQFPYYEAPAGLPLVQDALLSVLEHAQQKRMRIEQVVEKVAHNPATRYRVAERGYIREGYFADLVLVDPHATTTVSHGNALYRCGWTPFDSVTFSSSICGTWVNGEQVFDGLKVLDKPSAARRLTFNSIV